MRLIDADNIVFDYSGLCIIPPYDFIATAKYFENQIKAAPTITSESLVRHGRWIFHEAFEGQKHNCNGCVECSECNTWFGHDCYAKTNYCPNCGAKMDLGAEE